MRTSSIILSIVMLFQSLNITCNNILNLDKLIEHAQFHKEAYSDGFITFLSKHYGELKVTHSEKHQEEKEEHEKLPFQFDYHLVDFHTITFENTEVSLPSTLAFIERKQIFYHQNFYNSPDALGVFQPPRYI
ncbi:MULTISPECIES: hypothetical protein [Tenacibaculum]|uniref:Uncharacterized protein n=2 Tax=Tenacibaculum discolor TaxID=361581 RepID=A0ABT9F904_9FLAO|nr:MULTISPECIES: hypothetical protein [Tenacibaculum]MDP2542906.1 hypothetical protein [Tenacibaculum discolor]NVK09933.1 hypothetical protein [Tenacibaculum sp.]RLK02146.1 hypothetical protein C8N27_1278 [Tenacibaculum discolor]